MAKIPSGQIPLDIYTLPGDVEAAQGSKKKKTYAYFTDPSGKKYYFGANTETQMQSTIDALKKMGYGSDFGSQYESSPMDWAQQRYGWKESAYNNPAEYQTMLKEMATSGRTTAIDLANWGEDITSRLMPTVKGEMNIDRSVTPPAKPGATPTPTPTSTPETTSPLSIQDQVKNIQEQIAIKQEQLRLATEAGYGEGGRFEGQQIPRTLPTLAGAPNTLYEYYTSKGLTLPSIPDRGKLYQELGLGSAGSYVGNADQNKNLLKMILKRGAGTLPPAETTPSTTVGTAPPEAPPPTQPVSTMSREQILAEIDRVKAEIAKKQAEEKAAREAGYIPGTPTGKEEIPPSVLEGAVVGTSDQAEKEKREKAAAEADKLLKEASKLQDEAGKLTLQKQIQDLRESLGLDKETGLAKPTLPTLTTDFEALRSEKGVQALETQINNLSQEIRDTEASLRLGLQKQEGRLAPMELIGTRQLELRRQGQEQLDALNRRKQTMVDELTTKNTLISNIMNLKQTDYSNAANLYQNEFSKNIQLATLISNRMTREDQIANQAIDDARANLTTLYNLFKDSNLAWSQLTPEQRLTIEKLEIKSGMPSGLATKVMNENPDSKIQTVNERTDEKGDVYFDILLVDKNNKLTLKSVYRGKGKAVSGVPDVKTLTSDQQVFINRIQALIEDMTLTFDEAVTRFPDYAVYLKP